MRFVLLPLVMANLAVMISTFFLDWFIIGPPISRMWRTRRFLADASAVQLTRNPNGLASALKRIRDRGGYIPGGGLASHLFVFWNASSSGKKSDVLIWRGVHPSIHRRLKRFQKLGSQVAVMQALRRKGSPLATIIGLLLVSPLLVLAIGLMVMVVVMLVFLVLLVLGVEMMFMLCSFFYHPFFHTYRAPTIISAKLTE